MGCHNHDIGTGVPERRLEVIEDTYALPLGAMHCPVSTPTRGPLPRGLSGYGEARRSHSRLPPRTPRTRRTFKQKTRHAYGRAGAGSTFHFLIRSVSYSVPNLTLDLAVTCPKKAARRPRRHAWGPSSLARASGMPMACRHWHERRLYKDPCLSPGWR